MTTPDHDPLFERRNGTVSNPMTAPLPSSTPDYR